MSREKRERSNPKPEIGELRRLEVVDEKVVSSFMLAGVRFLAVSDIKISRRNSASDFRLKRASISLSSPKSS